jgi:hypothetical protein
MTYNLLLTDLTSLLSSIIINYIPRGGKRL